MSTIDQVAADLNAAPRPILFLDTCTLLDIVRAPLRDQAETVRAGIELRTLAANRTIGLVVQDIVNQEWNDNLAAVRRDGNIGVQAFTATWQIAFDLGQPSPPPPVLPPGNLVDELENLSRSLLAAAVVLDRDRDSMSWAIDRVIAKQKPSSAKGTVKDCHILGHALTLSFRLEAAGYTNWRVMVSSNTADFAAPNSTLFHPDIVPFATPAGLRYATSLSAVVSDLRGAGQIP